MVHGLIGRIHHPKGAYLESREYSFGIGRKQEARKGELFIPLSEKQFQKMAEFEKILAAAFKKTHGVDLKEVETGRAGVMIDSESRIISWNHFYPFTEHADTLSTEPKRSGIGAKIHHAIVADLLKKYKGYKVVHSIDASNVSEARRQQLRAMGIDDREEYPIERYAALSRAYLTRLRQRQAAQADGKL